MCKLIKISGSIFDGLSNSCIYSFLIAYQVKDLYEASDLVFTQEENIIKSLKYLEKYFDKKIFKIKKNKIEFTEFADYLYDKMKDQDNIEKIETVKSKIRITVADKISLPKEINHLFNNFTDKYKNHTIHILKEENKEIIESVIHGNTDIGILFVNFGYKLDKNSTKINIFKTNELNNFEIYKENNGYILTLDMSTQRDLTEKMYEQTYEKIKISNFSVFENLLKIDLIKENLGRSIISGIDLENRYIKSKIKKDDMKVKPFESSEKLQYVLIYRKEKAISEEQLFIINEIIDIFNTLKQKNDLAF